MSATVPPIFSDPASATSSLVSNAPPPQPSKSPEEAFVNRQLAFYEEQYTVMENITIALCTFNVASKKPPTDLSLLLPSSSRLIPTGTAINSETPPDIVSVSLQEVDMSATALIKEETEAATPWVSKMRELIGADYDRSDAVCPYYPLVTKQLVGLLSFLFVKKTLMRQIKDVQVSVVATGAMGTMANKGAIGVRVVINLTAILFINAHLAAGQESTKKRNEDIATILSELKFQAQGGVDSGASTTPDSGSDAANAQETDVSTTDADVVTAKQHDVIFVSGDLNYRIDVTYEEACEMIIHNDLAGLLKQDQLKKEMRAPHTPWEKFTDIPVAFMPTYRFDIGTCTYDTSDKKRIPAFTDRILYWARSRRYQDAIRVLSMQSFPVISSSDHKPVRAIVQAPIKKVNPIARAQCVTNLRHTVEELGLDRVATAKTVISTTSLDFGVQSYLSHGKAHVITVENVGECVAEFSVCRRMEGDSTQGMWLHVSDLQMSVFPKESVELVVQCTLDSAALRPWIRTYAPFTQKAMCPLTSLLVISVVDGPAHFVECNVVVKPSAFGNTLDNLLKLRRSPCDVAYAGSPQDEIRNDAPRPQVPKEIWFLCDALFLRGKAEAGLFVEHGDPNEMKAVMEHLDQSATPIAPEVASPISIATCLLTFLRDLAEPVIPFKSFTGALQAAKSGKRAAFHFVSSLPPAHANIFIYLMSFLRFLLKPQYASRNELTVEVVAQIYAQVLIQKPPQSANRSSFRNGGRKPFQALREELQAERADAAAFVAAFLVDQLGA